MHLLPMYDFVISRIGHLKNISPNYTDFPNIDTSYYTHTHTFVNITVDLIRALFKYWEAVIITDTNFPQY